jgi:hypothetical protein
MKGISVDLFSAVLLVVMAWATDAEWRADRCEEAYQNPAAIVACYDGDHAAAATLGDRQP